MTVGKDNAIHQIVLGRYELLTVLLARLKLTPLLVPFVFRELTCFGLWHQARGHGVLKLQYTCLLSYDLCIPQQFSAFVRPTALINDELESKCSVAAVISLLRT